jgi:hypothetical protein
MTSDLSAQQTGVVRRAARGAAGGAAGALGGLGLFLLGSISVTMSVAPDEALRRMTLFSRMPAADFERFYLISHIVALIVFVGVGAATGILCGRAPIGARCRWMAYGALTGVAFVALVSYVVDLRFPDAQLFDHSENAAFEFKFRAAQYLGLIGCFVGMVLYHLHARRSRNGV